MFLLQTWQNKEISLQEISYLPKDGSKKFSTRLISYFFVVFLLEDVSDAYLEPTQISAMELFLNIFGKKTKTLGNIIY